MDKEHNSVPQRLVRAFFCCLAVIGFASLPYYAFLSYIAAHLGRVTHHGGIFSVIAAAWTGYMFFWQVPAFFALVSIPFMGHFLEKEKLSLIDRLTITLGAVFILSIGGMAIALPGRF